MMLLVLENRESLLKLMPGSMPMCGSLLLPTRCWTCGVAGISPSLAATIPWKVSGQPKMPTHPVDGVEGLDGILVGLEDQGVDGGHIYPSPCSTLR